MARTRFWLSYALTVIWVQSMPSTALYEERRIQEECLMNSEIVYQMDIETTAMQVISGGNYSQYPKATRKCSVTVKAPHGCGLVLTVNKLSSIRPDGNRKCREYIEVTGDPGNSTILCRAVEASETIAVFSHAELKLSFVTDRRFATGMSYDLIVTPFQRHSEDQSSFRCRNGLQISTVFVCDSKNNCGDNSDEDKGYYLVSAMCGIISLISEEPARQLPDFPTGMPNPEIHDEGADLTLIFRVVGAVVATVAVSCCYAIIRYECRRCCRATETRPRNDGHQGPYRRF